uniref:Insulin-like domain-containing protein n=1 Tax=Acrobeloides nanus TaxID=290746 RepID=A0A914D9I7_9BILA
MTRSIPLPLIWGMKGLFRYENIDEDGDLAYFEGLKIAKECCSFGCSVNQLEQLCCTFSYKKPDEEQKNMTKLRNSPYKPL